MAETKTKVLVLSFKNKFKNTGKALRIPYPRPDLTAKEIKAVMDEISRLHFIWAGTEIEMDPAGAKIVETNSKSFDLTVTDEKVS